MIFCVSENVTLPWPFEDIMDSWIPNMDSWIFFVVARRCPQDQLGFFL